MKGLADIEALRFALRQGHTPWIKVEGQSMWPLLQADDQIRLQQPGALRRGDVVLVKRDRFMVVHRIIKMWIDNEGRTMLCCKGDASRVVDASVPLAAVIGTAVARRRGQKISCLRNPCMQLFAPIFASLSSRMGTLLGRSRLAAAIACC